MMFYVERDMRYHFDTFIGEGDCAHTKVQGCRKVFSIGSKQIGVVVLCILFNNQTINNNNNNNNNNKKIK